MQWRKDDCQDDAPEDGADVRPEHPQQGCSDQARQRQSGLVRSRMKSHMAFAG